MADGRQGLLGRRTVSWAKQLRMLAGVGIVFTIPAWAQQAPDPFEAAPAPPQRPAQPRPSHQKESPTSTLTPAPAPPSFLNNGLQGARSSLLGLWRGTYSCLQGETGVELSFTELRDDGAVMGTFKFFNLPGHSNSASGEFTLVGRLDVAQQKLYFSPGNWITQPPGYAPIGFSASLPLPGQRRISGSIAFPGCTQIYADKIGN